MAVPPVNIRDSLTMMGRTLNIVDSDDLMENPSKSDLQDYAKQQVH
jgi:hypothetical protein